METYRPPLTTINLLVRRTGTKGCALEYNLCEKVQETGRYPRRNELYERTSHKESSSGLKARSSMN